MSTYIGDKPDQLRTAVISLFSQTLQPNEVVIVADGPLLQSQEQVLLELQQRYCEIRLFKLEENVGRGRARNFAVAQTVYDYVFIMDSDDVALPNRFSVLVDVFKTKPDIGFVCGWAREFDDATGITVSIKKCPERDRDIRKAIRFTNVICNPSCGFRKSQWETSGGFPDFRDINEDHLFYLRMAAAGCRFHCIQEVVLDFRMTSGLYARRRGWKVFKSDVRFRWHCVREGHNHWPEALLYLSFFAVRRFAPASLGRLMQKTWRLWRG